MNFLYKKREHFFECYFRKNFVSGMLGRENYGSEKFYEEKLRYRLH